MGRRTLLRGAIAGLGATVALPPLEAMLNRHGTALADGSALPHRFGVWFWGNGVRLDSWVPATVGPNYLPSPALQPLADAGVLPMISVLSGFAVPFGQEIVHDVGRAAMLSGSYDVEEPTVGLGGNATLRSIDQIAADTLAQDAPFRSLEVGISQVGFGLAPDTSSVSWEQPVSPLPAEFSPAALFDRLFGDSLAATGLIEARLSVLDVVRADAEALRAKLGANDRARLEAHLDGLRAIENQLSNLSVECGVPARPGDPANDGLNNEPIGALSRAMSDLLVVAMACDLTRVFNYRFSPSAADTYYNDLGATEAHHVMSHDPAYQDTIAAIVTYIMGELGYLLQQLAAQQEGDGSILDNMVLLATSEVAEGLVHTTVDMPILVAGGAGGALTPGVHYRSPSLESTSMVGLTLLRASGVSVDRFGAGIGEASQTIAALEA